MEKPPSELIDGFLVRRMHRARVRQWAIALTSLVLAGCGLAFLSPASVGPFAYNTLLALMLLNAAIAIRQSICVIFPIETLLREIHRIERNVDEGAADPGHLSVRSNNPFACLAAGFDSLITKLSEKTREASERALLEHAMLMASPFTIYSVSRTGKVLSVVKDQYDLVPLLGLEAGREPSPELWGEQNAAKYLGEIAKSFACDDFRWFDLDVGSHHLRGSAKRVNDMTSIVFLGDLPAIDRTVENIAGTTSESDFTHRQESLRRFAATVAHDAKNVLTALGNLVEVNKASSDDAVREQTAVAEDAIRRGTTLLNELASFAGETHYRMSCVPAAKSLRTLFESQTIRALIPRNVQMMVSVSDEPMKEIDLDSDQMWKVVCNLIKNAIEAFNGNNGRIWIKAESCLLSDDAARNFRHSGTLRTGDGVLITVTDDGPGIPDLMLEHIFDPYTSSKREGRGLGLATVLAIVNAHGGAICVKSSPGYGTSFYIFLPASRNTEEELALMRQVAPNGEILLVDDDPTILHTTSLVLRALKIAAHPASTEEDALTKVRTLRSRLKAVLIDANIRCASSAGIVQAIRVEHPDLPVIVCSGSPEQTVERQFADTRYDKFLSKPYSVADLSRAIGAVSTSK